MSKRASILIVEDEISLQEAYKIVLSSQGHTVHTANNGVEGLVKFKKLAPRLVLLDLFMPLMDGKEFLRNIDLDEYPKTKIIVYSNLSDRNTEQEVIKLGADKYILKSSMSPSDLVRLIESYI